MDDFVERALL